MNECSGNQYACAKMFAGEEDFGWNLHPFDSFGNNGESSS
jgi:hypothetical protein